MKPRATEPEIEVTPAMIEAALAELWRHNLVDPLEIGRGIMGDVLRAALSNRATQRVQIVGHLK